MSFKNFVPIPLAEKVNTELEKTLVFYENCNHDYESIAADGGDAVKILNAGKPTITVGTNGRLQNVSREELQGSSILLEIKQVAQAHYGINDIDKFIAKGNLYSAYLEETKNGFADEMDAYIAKFAKDKNVEKVIKTTAVSTSNILDYIDECKVKLLENNVKRSDPITLTASPKFIDLLKRAYVNLDTNNSGMLQNGQVGKYNGIIVKESNNVYTATESSVDYEYIMLRTNKAIGFVKPQLKLEAYRDHAAHTDALAAYARYDGCVCRPKEVITLKVKYA